MNIKVTASKKKIEGAIDIDGDKSITHRAIMIASIAKGTSIITNYLNADDCISTINIMKALGVNCVINENKLIIKGNGLFGLKEPKSLLFAGNSGTTMRLLTGILSGQKFLSVLYGDESLNNRPMKRIIDPLNSFGAKIYGRADNSYAPIVILPENKLTSFKYYSKIASAQVKSAILFSALFNENLSIYREVHQSRDHTERMLEFFGADIIKKNGEIFISGKNELIAENITVPGDFSTAAYFLALAATTKFSKIVLKFVNINETRTGFFEVLKKMGLKFEIKNMKRVSNEPVGDIQVESSDLKNVCIKEEEIAKLIDEIPLLAFVATQASGVMVIEGVKELAYKESNRIKTTEYLFKKFGLDINIDEDKMIIKNTGLDNVNEPIHINHFGDHRVAMTAIIMSLVLKKDIVMERSEIINISSPNFINTINQLTGSVYVNE